MKKIIFILSLLVVMPVQSNEFEGFIKACVTTSGLGVEICRCIAKRANQELSPGGFQFLTAKLNRDKQIMESLRWRLKEPELNQLAMIMTHAPKQCEEALQEMNQEDGILE